MPQFVHLGKWYRDTETGFIGVADSLCISRHSEDQVFLQNHMNHRWVETKRVEEIDKPAWVK